MNTFTAAAPAAVPAMPASRVRYLILAMLFLVTAFNYADRATLSITGSAMQKEFGLEASSLGFIFSAFAWAYVAAQIPGGWLLDKFGTRLVYAGSIALWSLFTLLQGIPGFVLGGSAIVTFFVLRAAVGIAEAPSFPGNSRLVTAWFPSAERGLASAVFNSAQYFSTVLFAPLMAWIAHSYGWREVYYVMGASGLLLALLWLKVIYEPRRHPRINAAELAHIEGDAAASVPAQVSSIRYLPQLLRNRMLMGIYFGQYFITTLTYFFLTWFPVYLVQARGMSILKAGFVAALPAVAGFAGGILGGWLSDRMIKRGYSLTAARKSPIVCGMLLSTSIILCNYVDTHILVIAVMALAFFGKGVGALGWAVVADTSPKEVGGLSGALFNTFGNTAGITTPIVIGFIVQATGSFSWALVFVGANALAAIVCYLLIVGEIKRAHIVLN